MTEDETFIRAIVGAPGDDTPRLVYADWLDDRADPRGAYLRTEMEWAKPWRAGERPADSPELRELAIGLDPMWVARVSRPPVGVSCEHFVIKETGPELSRANLGQVEREFGFELPLEYAAFLLNHNGGHPYPVGDWLLPSAYPLCDEEYRFYPVNLPPGQHQESGLQFEITRYLTKRLPTFLERSPYLPDVRAAWYWDFIPICDTPDTFTYILGVRGPRLGQITSVDWSAEPDSFVREYVFPSFAWLLHDFRPGDIPF